MESQEIDVSTLIGVASAFNKSRLEDSALSGWIISMSSLRLRFSA